MKVRTVSVVVIGLDEAEHLGDCIAALSRQGLDRDALEVFYVDSGSTDGSPDVARAAGVRQVLSVPRAEACAGVARNAGLARAQGDFIQFVDGDSILEPGWLATAIRILEEDEALAGVAGRLREARPEKNVYQRVYELDWPATPGDAPFLGGNALYRTRAIREVGAFDPLMRLGEEPELGVRLRKAGWRLRQLDAPMARHDLGLNSLRDWLARGYRSGLSCAMVVRRTGGLCEGFWRGRLLRTLGHAAVLTLPPIAGLALLAFAPALAVLLLALSPLVLLLLVARKLPHARARGLGLRDAVAFGLHTYLAKLPTAAGIMRGLTRALGARAPSSDDPRCATQDDPVVS